jgi:mono/diheme cytochrome c family protein
MQASLLSIPSSNHAWGGEAQVSAFAVPFPVRHLASAMIAGLLLFSQGAMAQDTTPAAQQTNGQPEAQPPAASVGDIDGETMFATSCGFCHEEGGRRVGKGPKLANSKRSDAYIIDRIKQGKLGSMPAFGRVFGDGQIIAILAYIRGLDE